MPEQPCFPGYKELISLSIKSKLQERFIVPPFSILDTKQGYWQERKRLWAALGIQSEIGRGGNLLYEAPEITDPQLNYYRKQNQELKDATVQHQTLHPYDGQQTKEATSYKAQASLNAIMAQKPGNVNSQAVAANNGGMSNTLANRKKIEANSKDPSEKGWRESKNSLGNLTERFQAGETVTETVERIAGVGTGTSIFDPVLTELMYKWFCPQAGTILDPFAGGSVRGIVAGVLGYTYHGIDLSTAQVKANYAQLPAIQCDIAPIWHNGSSERMNELIPDLDCDMVFSCPPYHDLEQYTDDPEDLSNMGWSDFKTTYFSIITKAASKLRNNRFACFVVSEIRDDRGFYKGFVPFTIACFANAGMQFYNEIILVNVAGSLPIRVNGQFSANRKIGRMHQNVLVFYKGDIKEIRNNYREIDTEMNGWA